MITGAAILLSGILIGRILRLPHRGSGSEPKQPKPICGCTHNLAQHDPKTNECHEIVNGEPLAFDLWNSPYRWKQIRCTCRQYTGPKPAEMYFSTPLITD